MDSFVIERSHYHTLDPLRELAKRLPGFLQKEPGEGAHCNYYDYFTKSISSIRAHKADESFVYHTETCEPSTIDLSSALYRAYLDKSIRNNLLQSWLLLIEDAPNEDYLIRLEADLASASQEETELLVASRFSSIGEVVEIYFHWELSEMVFTILLDNDHYDSALMQRLIDIEIELLDEISRLALSFSYFPEEAKPYTVAQNSKLVFKRFYGTRNYSPATSAA